MAVERALNPEEIQSFSSEIPGVQELRRWALYDRIVSVAAATLLGAYNFFTVPIGGGAVPKTLLDTNLRQAGQLPARQGFEIWDIRVLPQIALLIDSITTMTILNNCAIAAYTLLYGGFFTLSQAQKTDLEISPIALLGAGYGAASTGGYGATVTPAAASGGGYIMATNGTPSSLALWGLAPLPIVILPQRSFSVSITYPVAIVLPAGVGLNQWVHLDGVLHRSA